MFRIGEFSRLTQVSVRLLRYYDAQGLLKPALTDPFTGYRLYTAEQIPQLQRVLLLRDAQFTVGEMAPLLARWEEGAVAEGLRAKKRELERELEQQRRRVEKIGAALQDLAGGRLEVHCNVVLKAAPGGLILALREMIPDYFCEGRLWEKLAAFVRREGVEPLPGASSLAIFYGGGGQEEGVDVEAAVRVKRAGQDKDGFVYRQLEPVETMACVMVHGPYENIGPAYHAFAVWLEEHRQYEMAGPSRQICHIGPGAGAAPEQFLTEVQTPVRLRA